MNKQELKDKYFQMFLEGEDLSEYSMFTNHSEFFEQIILKFGSIANFEKELKILKRHFKERKKFFLYWTLKLRAERFGREALRNKNIEKELTQEIVNEFKTVKYIVKDLIQEQKKEAVIYEIHARLLCGKNFTEIELEEPEVIDTLRREFDNIKNFSEQYQKHFLIDPSKVNTGSYVNYEKEVESDESQDHLTDLRKLIDMGYITEADARNIQQENRREREKKEVE